MSWQESFKYGFLRKPGEHLLVNGITGSGKTQDLLWIMDGILHEGQNEIILWNDLGKSAEILLILKFGPVNIILPEFMDIEINMEGADVKKSWFQDPKDVWFKIDKDRINILCVEPFVRDPVDFTPVVTAIFSALIDLAHDGHIPTPLCIMYDEFHHIAPGKGHAFNARHASFGAKIEFNIERLRSLGIRFVGSIHSWTKLRKGVRTSFNWFHVKRGGLFSHEDQPRLSKFNTVFEKMATERVIIAFPNKVFSDYITVPYYGEGHDLGTVRYIGKLSSQASPKIQDIIKEGITA